MKRKQQPKTRSYVAIAAWNRNGGKMGGSAREQNKRNRKVARQEARDAHI